MSFHEVSLPARLAFGSTGGVERRTEVVTLASGFERRSTPWAEGRRRWLIGANLRSLADMAELVAFFEARAGRLHGFRFRDFMDFRSCPPGAEPAATDQAIGTGDGETAAFQLAKGGRVIRKPVAGSAVVAVDGVGVAAEVDATTGVVTLSAAPAEGAAVTAGFLFDVPVRFDADRIDVTLESFDAGRMAAVPLVEVRV
jgi:uncharacterized protein (TIGR02217 family)